MKDTSPRRFSWLHLSEFMCTLTRDPIHEGQLQALRKDLDSLTKDYGPWDVLFITGDLTKAGKELEYERVSRLLEEHLLPHLSSLGSNPRVLSVPGNHDVNRSILSKSVEARLLRFWSEDAELRRDFWNLNLPYKKVVDSAFRNYSNWFNYRIRLEQHKFRLGIIPGDFATAIDTNNLKVGVVALNTSFAELTFKGMGAISGLQLDAVCGKDAEKWSNLHDFNILLTHHPPNRLDRESQKVLRAYIAPPGRFMLHLCGNQHNSTEVIRLQQSPALLIQSPPFTMTRANSPGYVAGSIQVHSGTAELSIRPRRYDSARNSFVTASHDPRVADEYQRVFHLNTSSKQRQKKRTTQAQPLPLTVERLELKNFRNFERLLIDFNVDSSLPGRWTCLAGINGAGKSSILQALSLILLGEPLVLELGGDRLGRMRRRTDGIKHDAEICAWINDRGKEHYLELNLRDKPERQSSDPGSYYSMMLDFWKSMRSRVVLSYGVTRNLSDYRETRHLSLSPDVRRVMTLFDPLTRIESAEVLLSRRLSMKSSIWSLFENLLKQIFSESFGVGNKNGRVVFTFEKETVDALDLPDGFRSSVAWLVDLCSAWAEKQGRKRGSKLSDMEAIVLIDEIDLHLHPSLQRTLVPRLRKALPRVQWIVTTHSPLILSSFDTAEIVALDRTEPSGIRFLDRQILGFSTDEVYDWLMDTPPTSLVMEQKLAEKEASPNLVGTENLAELLEMSPNVDAHLAEDRVSRRRQLLRMIESKE